MFVSIDGIALLIQKGDRVVLFEVFFSSNQSTRVVSIIDVPSCHITKIETISLLSKYFKTIYSVLLEGSVAPVFNGALSCSVWQPILKTSESAQSKVSIYRFYFVNSKWDID